MSVEKLQLDRSDWQLVKFGDVAIKSNASVDRETTELTRYIAGEHMGSEDLHLRNWGNVNDGYLGPAFTRRFSKGDILYGSRRTYLRKVAVADFDGITANTTFVIKANEELILPALLPFVMLSEGFAQHSIRNSKGSVNPYVNWKDIASYEFQLPPKDQQAKLAELLWAGYKSDDQLRMVSNSLENLRDASFKSTIDALSGIEKNKVADLLLDGPRNGYSPKGNESGSSLTVSIGAVAGGLFSVNGNEKRADASDDILAKFNVDKSDVFVVRGNGNRQLCGRAGLSLQAYPNVFYPDLLIRLRFDPKTILPEFAAFQWNHASSHQRLLQWAKSTNGIWKINGADIKNHSLFVPAIDKQEAIMNELNQIGDRLSHMKTAHRSSVALQKALINQIF